ncbi:MAG: hypothetical protein HYZ44_09685 [Bacteroidetes bacterium]|nr:hypothetical protein [Bacteroidota bacterium]
MRRIFLFSLSIGGLCGLLTISSCVREEDDLSSQNCSSQCTVVSGKFVTHDGTQPIPNVPVTLYWRNILMEAGGVVRKKATGITNSNGDFMFKFSMRDDELAEGYFTVKYDIRDTNYWTIGDKEFPIQKLRRDTMVFSSYLIPVKAYLDLQITNPNDIKPTDYFYTSFRFRYGEYAFGTGVIWKSIPEQPLEIAGNQKVFVATSRIKSGVASTTYDTLLLQKGERKVYSVTF